MVEGATRQVNCKENDNEGDKDGSDRNVDACSKPLETVLWRTVRWRINVVSYLNIQ